MNKHIELVKKWLADKDSVSKQELEDNRDAADAYAADAADAYAAYAADNAYAAANADNADADAYVAYWVGRYEELTK